MPVQDFLLNKANISRVHAPFFRCLSGQDPLLLPDNKAKLTEFLHTHTLLELLNLHPYTIFLI